MGLLPALILIGLILLYLVLSKYLARKQKKREKEMGSSGLFFDCLDSDNSGTKTRDELRQGLAELGMSMSEATTFDVLDNIDTDGSGDVDRDEFGNPLSVSITTCVISLTPCCKIPQKHGCPTESHARSSLRPLSRSPLVLFRYTN